MSFTVLGVDPGTSHPAVAVIQRATVGGWELMQSPVLHSYKEYLDALISLKGMGMFQCVCVEDVSWALHAKGADHGYGSADILRCVGAAELFAAMYRIPLIKVQPQTWRKAIAGSARATKEQVRTALKHQVRGWPKQEISLNRSDAIAIGIAGARSPGRQLNSMSRTL